MKPILFALLISTIFFAACSPDNVTVDNSLKQYFDSAQTQGAFGFFDNGQGHFTIYNLPRYKDSLYQPGATFDILQSLIAIQTGVIKDDSSDLGSGITLLQAFQANPYIRPGMTDQFPQYTWFIPLAHRLGQDTLKKWIDSLQYGNKHIDTTAFWTNNTLKINADQQLGLMKKLYFNQLPFFNRSQLLVRNLLLSENNSSYRLCYKTAQGKKEDGHAIGWVMGWIEENKHPYFFVLNLESADPNKDLGAAGLDIAKKILKEQGFFQGKK